MCGIVGEFVFHEEYRSYVNWDQLLKLMEKRGPDDEGFWTDNKHVTFAFKRLSIIDLTANANQPMVSNDKRYILLFNGELYNYIEIRTYLISKGFSFQSRSDTEVVLYAIKYWGIKKALARFNGMFALAFYDTKFKKLYLARDHVGIKPLYFIKNKLGVFFASQYDQIMMHPWIKKNNISNEALRLYMHFGFIPAPFAIFENTYMLTAGCYFTIDKHNCSEIIEYYKFPVYQEPDIHGNEALNVIEESIFNAVQKQLISDVPLGSFLSGGIDSPLVTAIAQMNNNSFKTFTIGSFDKEMNEIDDAKQYAKDLKIEHFCQSVTTDNILSLLDNYFEVMAEPFADYSLIPTILVSKLAKNHVTVALSGDGGDELFWGYEQRFNKILNELNLFSSPKSLRFMRLLLKRGKNKIGREVLQNNIGDRFLLAHTIFPIKITKKIFPNLPEFPSEFNLFKFNDCSVDYVMQWLRWNEINVHLSRILLKVDRASMYNSLEVRVPLLDKEVLHASSRIYWGMCLSNEHRVGKIPLRILLSKHLGNATSGKKGFRVPISYWLKTELKPIFQEYVFNRDNILGLEINKKALTKNYDLYINHADSLHWGFFSFLMLSMWEKKFLNK